MIYVIDSYTVPESIGNVVGAKTEELAKKLTAYWRKRWPETDPKVIRNITGDTTRISWIYKVKSVAEMEPFAKAIVEDSGMKALLDEWSAAEKVVGSLLITQPKREYYSVLAE